MSAYYLQMRTLRVLFFNLLARYLHPLLRLYIAKWAGKVVMVRKLFWSEVFMAWLHASVWTEENIQKLLMRIGGNSTEDQTRNFQGVLTAIICSGLYLFDVYLIVLLVTRNICMVLNDCWKMNWKLCERNRTLPGFSYNPRICVEELNKTTKELNSSPWPKSEPGPGKYKVAAHPLDRDFWFKDWNSWTCPSVGLSLYNDIMPMSSGNTSFMLTAKAFSVEPFRII
jgi:hypothetical protein